MPGKEVPRHAEARIAEALADTRIVAVEGPRQAGKSTLCTKIAAERGMRAVSLDDPNTRDLRGMTRLRELAGERFLAGLILCTARQTVPLGTSVWALPIEALWA